MKKIKIIENPCNIHKKKLEIGIGYYDFETGKKSNEYINPNEIDEIILTRSSKISTDIFKLNPNLTILCFNNGKPVASFLPLDNLPTILKNEELFSNLSKYKQRRLTWIFCRGVSSSRIKTLFRLNETRNNKEVSENLKKMREINLKIKHYATKQELMGFEGNIAKLFYNSLGKLNPDFIFKRDRLSKDIVNVLMNFCHTILRERVKIRIIANGINPYHSFLHGKEDRSEQYLSWDFTEFWIPYVDKLIFYSLERGIVKKDDITDGRLSIDAKNKIVRLINERISTEEIDSKIQDFLKYLKGKGKFSWK